jgi:hypothetical protein
LGVSAWGGKKDAIIGEEGAHAVGVSFEPCLFVLLVQLFDFRHVSGGQGTCRSGNDWVGEQNCENPE